MAPVKKKKERKRRKTPWSHPLNSLVPPAEFVATRKRGGGKRGRGGGPSVVKHIHLTLSFFPVFSIDQGN